MKLDILIKTALSAIATGLLYFVAKDAFDVKNRPRSRPTPGGRRHGRGARQDFRR